MLLDVLLKEIDVQNNSQSLEYFTKYTYKLTELCSASLKSKEMD